MSPAISPIPTGATGMRQMVRRPRDSDGVGSALRQVFARPAGLPADLNKLLDRLDQND